MRIAPLLVLLVTMIPLSRAAAALSDEQRTLFFGHDQRQAIMDPTGWPWQAIGQVETAGGNLCTATLISAHLALTAGHCVLTPPLCYVLSPTTSSGAIRPARSKHWSPLR